MEIVVGADVADSSLFSISRLTSEGGVGGGSAFVVVVSGGCSTGLVSLDASAGCSLDASFVSDSEAADDSELSELAAGASVASSDLGSDEGLSADSVFSVDSAAAVWLPGDD